MASADAGTTEAREAAEDAKHAVEHASDPQADKPAVEDAALEEFNTIRPVTAPPVLQDDEEEDDGEVEELADLLDLDAMTADAVTLFRAGQQREALDMAVTFSNAARELVGHTDPTYINALATVAAFVDQMGGQDEADAILLEAEELQDEAEMEALGIDQLDGEEDLSTDASSNDNGSIHGDRAELADENDAGDTEPANRRSASRTTCSDKSDAYSDDDFIGLSSEGDLESEMDADLDIGSSDGAGSDGEEEEVEAEAITRLTWEVNDLLKKGNPEEAARLLSEAEKLLVQGGCDISGISKAALHTLWAAVLDDVGENEKAQCLYHEALQCLEDEGVVRPGASAGSTSDGTESEESETPSDDLGDESSESESDDAAGDCAEDEVAELPGQDAGRQSPVTAERPAADDDLTQAAEVAEDGASSAFLTAMNGDELACQGAAATAVPSSAQPLEPVKLVSSVFADIPGPALAKSPESLTKAPVAEPAAQLEQVQTLEEALQPIEVQPLAKPTLDLQTPKLAVEASGQALEQAAMLPDAGVEGANAGAERSTASAATAELGNVQKLEPKAPSQPAGASPRKRRPPPLAPAAKAAAGQPPAARVGGGFVGAPKSKAKAKAKAKAKSASKVVVPEAEAAAGEEVGVAPTEAAEATATEVATSEAEVVQMPAEEEVVTEAKVAEEQVKEPVEPPTSEQQLATIKHAMTSADHYVGLLKFEKAADKLEEQLTAMADESCPHRHSDLHVEVLMKYGGVLWWEGDADGAVDAFAAADEILEDRPGPRGGDPKIKRRRAEIWMQCAQVFRVCGELDGADEQLSTAVKNLQDLVEAAGPDAETEYVDALKEAQAALAQVCVQKKEFERAEGLYCAAFGEGDADDQDGHADEKTFAEKLEIERAAAEELLCKHGEKDALEDEAVLKDGPAKGEEVKNQATNE